MADEDTSSLVKAIEEETLSTPSPLFDAFGISDDQRWALGNPLTSLNDAITLLRRVLPGWREEIEPRDFQVPGKLFATVLVEPCQKGIELGEIGEARTVALALCSAIVSAGLARKASPFEPG